ncbi:MAG TPA: hypothetical protein PLL30_03430 [Candidatus Krumholzibacteria bacterium]|nr:hypothetical protein [Candidatus Krumholzibacteria bacterium]HPD70825.1 hypothetical protein [Candidatus Krumholzibacteria bacterium]HRY39475.1 hypothetical protein [Candidatus Krumholzibacteria bacterium]
MDIESTLIRFIAEEVLQDGGAAPPARDEPLIASGRIDSFGLMLILGFIQQRWRIDLMVTGNLEDFESVATMAAAIRRHARD